MYWVSWFKKFWKILKKNLLRWNWRIHSLPSELSRIFIKWRLFNWRCKRRNNHFYFRLSRFCFCTYRFLIVQARGGNTPGQDSLVSLCLGPARPADFRPGLTKAEKRDQDSYKITRQRKLAEFLSRNFGICCPANFCPSFNFSATLGPDSGTRSRHFPRITAHPWSKQNHFQT